MPESPYAPSSGALAAPEMNAPAPVLFLPQSGRLFSESLDSFAGICNKVGDTMIITPHVVNTLFYLVILLGGLDFILSGLKVLTRKNTELPKKTWLLGLRIIRTMQVHKAVGKHTNLFTLMFSPKVMGIYTLASGVLLVVASILMLCFSVTP